MGRILNNLIKDVDLSDENKANMFLGRVEYLYECFCKYQLKSCNHTSHTDMMFRFDVPSLHNFQLKFEHNIKFDIEVHTYVYYDTQLARINGSNSPVIYCDNKDLEFYKSNPDYLNLEKNILNILWAIKRK